MKKNYNIKLAALATLLILLVSGIVIYSVLIFNDTNTTNALILFIMIMGLIGVIVQLNAINKKAMKYHGSDIESGTYEYVAKWSVSQKTWTEFNQLKACQELSETKSHAIIIGVFVLVVAAIISFLNTNWISAIYISFGAGLSLGFVAYFSIQANIRFDLKKSYQVHNPSIKFTDHLVFINDRMIQYDGMGIYLRNYEVKNIKGVTYLYLSIKQGHAAGHKSIKHYSFPFGIEGASEFRKIENRLKELSLHVEI